MQFARLSVVVALLMAVGCSSERRLKPYTEAVMTPGMKIECDHPNGAVYVTAGNGTLHTYGGNGWQKAIRLIARDQRWNGSLGLYEPAESSTPYGRVLAEEGRLHFSSIDEALRWLAVGSAHEKPVFRNDGLVVCYSVAGAVEARDITVWQIYVDGKRPTYIPGGNDLAITVTGGGIAEASEPYPAPVGMAMVFGDKPFSSDNPPIADGGSQ
jgi:hypothetical protein